jgi:hypothetical protein
VVRDDQVEGPSSAEIAVVPRRSLEGSQLGGVAWIDVQVIRPDDERSVRGPLEQVESPVDPTWAVVWSGNVPHDAAGVDAEDQSAACVAGHHCPSL